MKRVEPYNDPELGDVVLWRPMLMMPGGTIPGLPCLGVVYGIEEGGTPPQLHVRFQAVIDKNGFFMAHPLDDIARVVPMKDMILLSRMDAGRTRLEAEWLVYSALGYAPKTLEREDCTK